MNFPSALGETSTLSSPKSSLFFWPRSFSQEQIQILNEEIRYVANKLDIKSVDADMVNKIIRETKPSISIIVISLIFLVYILGAIYLALNFIPHSSSLVNISIVLLWNLFIAWIILSGYGNQQVIALKWTILNPQESGMSFRINFDHELVHKLKSYKIISCDYVIEEAVPTARLLENNVLGYPIWNTEYFLRGRDSFVKVLEGSLSTDDIILPHTPGYLENYYLEYFIAGIAYEIYQKTEDIDLVWKFIRQLANGSDIKNMIKQSAGQILSFDKERRRHVNINGSL